MENLSRIKWLKGEVEANRKMTEQLLVELVKIDTITDNLTGYNQALYIIQNFLEESGFATLLIGPGDKKNLLAYMGDYKNPKLLLNGHLDVVGVGDVKTWERYPFSATIESGRLYGRGSCDMKGGIAAMLMAARVISKLEFDLKGQLVVAVTIDEEVGGKDGLLYLLNEGECGHRWRAYESTLGSFIQGSFVAQDPNSWKECTRGKSGVWPECHLQDVQNSKCH
jgi:acetylornithine deacetylase/succinyl-diaminopimelate desuccinylase-like protein